MIFLAIMRRWLNSPFHIFITLIFIFSATAPAGAGDINSEKLVIRAPSAYLLDSGTGEVLYGKGAHTRRAIASTTKILTALIVLEKARLQDEVTVSPGVATTGGAVIGLKSGERRSVEELLHALMLVSANDAASALAEHVGGSEADFARLMNERARELGATESSFTVPHGLAPAAAHFSTAADMARIAKVAMENETFRRLVSTRSHPWDTRGVEGIRQLQNTNALLDRYGPAAGVKTGFTAESGYCLVAGAHAGERTVIAVILGNGSRNESFDDGVRLLDWSLKKFDQRRLVKKNQRYAVIKLEGKRVPLVADRTIEGLIYLGDPQALVFRPHVSRRLALPLSRGEKAGYLEVTRFGQKTDRIGLTVGRSVWSSYASRNIGGHFQRVVKKMINLF